MPSSPSSSPPTAQSARPPVLRLTNPDDVFAAIPYLLGFHPQKSLVVLGLSGPRSRLGVSMRLDLEPAPPHELSSIVVNALRRDGDREAIVVLLDPSEQPHGRPGENLFRELRSALRRADIVLRDAYRVSNGRWWSYLCRDRSCCPSEGTPIRRPEEPGGPSRVAATAVAAGLAPLPSREALRASLEPPAPWTWSAADQALDRVSERVAQRWDRGERAEWQRAVLELLE